jgi:16S rRNA (adenine1518-N6/adenine1519-N6)-dimethyltransferase
MKLFAKKSLGQHFLNSKHVLEQIITAANIKEGEVILEIGPGTGFLTRALLNAKAKVIAVEKDERAFTMLNQDFFKEVQSGQLTLIQGDVLDGQIFNIQSLIFNSPYALVANIPYYITGAILEKFLENEPRPNRMILLVQKEVADRIIARDGKESILSVSVKAFGTPKLIAKVPPGAFTPAPSVDSAILSIENISDNKFHLENGKEIEIKRFFKIIRAGFAHKRKFLKRNLEEVMEKEKINEIWLKLGLDEKVRAEDLKINQWFDIQN